MYSVKAALDEQGVRPPLGGRSGASSTSATASMTTHTAPHLRRGLRVGHAGGRSPTRPDQRYGVWWFNRRRHETRHVAERGPDGERRYRRQSRVREKPRSEWIAVPVPDSGIPRDWVDRAREAIKGNTKPSVNASRFWELSGGMLFCAECGCQMNSHTTSDKVRGTAYHYYRCAKRNRHGAQHACVHSAHHRAEKAEEAVWDLIAALLEEPERLRVGLEELIEQERACMRANPDREAAAWLERLSEVEHERRGYLRLAAKGHMGDEDLAEALGELEDARKTAERELSNVRRRKVALEELERDRDALLESYAGMVPEALASLAPEERRQVYGMLRLRVEIAADGSMEARGVLSESLCESGVASACTTSSRRTAWARRRPA